MAAGGDGVRKALLMFGPLVLTCSLAPGWQAPMHDATGPYRLLSQLLADCVVGNNDSCSPLGACQVPAPGQGLSYWLCALVSPSVKWRCHETCLTGLLGELIQAL